MTAGARTQAGLEITSPANPRVKHLVALRHRRARDRAGVTLVEGFEELGLALAAGAHPVSLYVCPALVAEATRELLAELPARQQPPPTLPPLRRPAVRARLARAGSAAPS